MSSVMTPDEWKLVKAIASEAWVRPPAERDAYVRTACAGDGVLAREVLSLVAAMAAADERFEALPRWPTDVVRIGLDGRRFGPYEMVSRIGSGGMGDVYQARDTRLDRLVAIKVLPARASTSPASRKRMEREARAVAALNHPHICTLHDVGRESGLDYLVMEHLDGQTLALRLERGALPVAEALEYAAQIASALTAAHTAGIVHRDLKPGNIMLTSGDGRMARWPHVKLLDFGLATAIGAETLVGARHSETPASVDVTTTGDVLGTVPYMAPEQFEGRASDARTDVFAFGAVLFEMLTSRKAFPGTDATVVKAAILSEKRPRVSEVREQTPRALDRLVLRCLARNADERYPSMDEAAAELQTIRRRLDSMPRRRRVAIAAAGLLAAVASVTAWLLHTARTANSAPAPSITRLATTTGVLGAPALSPDGSQVVFSWFGDGFGDPELVQLQIGSTSRVRLTRDRGADEWPTWSPDGAQIAFIRCGAGRCAILALPSGGGPERLLRELRVDRYYSLAWSPDGRSIAYSERQSPSQPYSLFLLSTETGNTRRLTSPPRGIGDMRFAFSPDGETLAIVRLGDSIGVHLHTIRTGGETVLLPGQSEWVGAVTWAPDGQHLLLSANRQSVRRLWRLPIAGGGLGQVAVAGENAYYPSVASRGNRLAFVHDFYDWDLFRMRLDQRPVRAPSPVASSTQVDLDPAFSPDGQRIAFASERGGTREIWVSRTDGADAVQLTSLKAASKPTWSRDGQLIAFQTNGGIHTMTGRGGTPRTLSSDGELPTWSADGRWVYFRRVDSHGRFHIWKVPVAGGAPVQAIASEASAAHEGPDGADVYFVRVGGGIWRTPVIGGTETRLIPEFKESHPGYWAVVPDGIYYLAAEPDSDHVEFQVKFFDFATRRTTTIGALTGHVDDWVGGLTVSPDRQTVLYSQRSYHTSEVMLVENFR